MKGVIPRTIPDDWFTPRERAVWLRMEAGMSHKEVADDLDLTVSCVMTSACYARRRVRNGGPKASGYYKTTESGHWARIEQKLGLGGPQCRCGLRGGHECLSASGFDRRAAE